MIHPRYRERGDVALSCRGTRLDSRSRGTEYDDQRRGEGERAESKNERALEPFSFGAKRESELLARREVPTKMTHVRLNAATGLSNT